MDGGGAVRQSRPGVSSRSLVRPASGRARPRTPALLVVASAVLAVVVTVTVLGLTGQLDAAAWGLADPGAVVRYGLPAVRAVHDLAASATIGLLVVGTWCVAPDRGTPAGDIRGTRRTVLRAASTAAVVWLVTATLGLLLTTADVSGYGIGSAGFGGVLMSFLADVDLGRALGASALLVAVAAVLTVSATRVTTAAWAAAAALAALLPLSLSGHAAGSADHMNSVDSLALHLLGVTVWVGGLIALVVLAGQYGDQLPTVARRYSTLAAWCFVLVALSGLVNAVLRLGSFAGLGTGYGLLVLGKALALGLLGAAGWVHRRHTLPQLPDRLRFARLAAVEVLLMGATMGLAVALSRSVPPTADADPDPVAALLGFPAPPPLTTGRYLTAFYPDLLWLSVAAALAGLYLAGLVRMHRRGDRWPWYRTVFWLLGCAALVLVTSGGLAVYGRVHFSSHMIQHMSLMVLVPLLWVLGAPVTLALRTLPARRDRSLGPRETILLLVHSRPLRVLGHPVVAAGLFTGGLVLFYYTGLFELAMFTHTGHVLMTAHFLLTGYLFVWALIGVDPGPQRPAYPFRLLVLLVTLGFHAFFGISLMASQQLLAPAWWHAIGQRDDAALLADQQTGGAIAWALGDLPSLLLGLALVVGWVRSDTRRARQLDRQADRDGDAELRRYNERLAAMSRRDG